MDDLISRAQMSEAIRDYLKDLFTKGIHELEITEFYVDVQNIIEVQPTAYNVDKVVEQIENLKDLDNREQHCAKTKELDKCGDFDDCEQCILEKAISFVKVGGVNE